MIIVLNGPLGIGKSTLAEALSERIEHCVMLDGDHLVAANPPADDEREHLHSTIRLLVAHHQSFGYRHFVIDHLWTSREDLDDLCGRLRQLDDDIRCFLLTLPYEHNLDRIERRARARALDERDLELRTVQAERALLAERGKELGEPFDVSGGVDDLVEGMMRRLGIG